MTTIVHLVRHGEVHNPDRILYGRLPDWHLSVRGRQMAAALAADLSDHDVSHVVSSPLERACETAAPLAETVGIAPQVDDDLLEAGNDLEGLHIKGVRSALWNPKRWPMLKNPTVPSWGEPYTEILDRMWRAVDRARRGAEGGEAVCVTHQLPIVCVQRDVQGLPLRHNPAARRCELASVTSLVFEGDDLVDMVYSEPAQEI
ncbi:histidine phosphatase family protein [Corynebacterium glyciniphilum]|uniref:histidine phosphatase family protein n=1 Tax=Corynebacterium glyciniphilum TaxID=1404244 RepID=UPI0026553722|nr:histidine phosphatase family protein [Corynebacterium glyciniphilum]MDN5683230.1 histidine phosphatase family protein [Corynebacterium glyciniphilum]MDN6705425.1 histidine phosphatase family protein [Corynebacterium glyciniphilum]